MNEENIYNNDNETSHQNIDVQKPYDLIDGAAGDGLLDTSDYLKNLVKDANASIDDRLEAFEDIIDSEVGDSSLIRARNIEKEIGIKQIYLKFEGSNPTGTQKDRIAFAQAIDAIRRGFDTITLATCGNYGAACALASSLAGLRCLIFVPENYHTKRIKEMTDLGAEIMRVPGDYENAVVVSSEFSKTHEYYDANPGGDNLNIQLRAYGEIAYEIYDELRDAPGIVAMPVSNGSTLAGVYKGFLSLYRRGKTSRIPKMVAGSSFKKNPIIQAFQQNKDTCEDLIPQKIKETPVNEPLINWHSIDGDLALNAIRQSKGYADDATDKEMLHFSKLLREREGISVMPASTAGLISLSQLNKKEQLNNDRFVIVLTGRK